MLGYVITTDIYVTLAEQVRIDTVYLSAIFYYFTHLAKY